MKIRGAQAFTLVEVLVAMAIFSVLSLLAYQALAVSMTNADVLENRMDRLRDIQQAVRLLSRDIVQAAPRPVRDPLDNHLRPAFQVAPGGEFALEVTHAGWPNPGGLQRSTLQRSAWRVQDGVLSRLYWTVLDPAISAEPLVTEVLDEVDGIAFRFYFGNGEWSDQWPPQASGGGDPVYSRPRMVQVVLTLRDEGVITRNLEVAP